MKVMLDSGAFASTKAHKTDAGGELLPNCGAKMDGGAE